VRSVQWDPAADGTDLITTTGVNDERASRIITRDSGEYQRLRVSGASTPTSGREGGVTRECVLLLQMGLVLTVPIAAHAQEHKREREQEHKQEHGQGRKREHERELSPNPPNEQPSRDAHLHTEVKSEVRNQGERRDQGTVDEPPAKSPPKHSPVDDLRCKGKFQRPGDALSIHVHQFTKRPGRTWRLRLPPFLRTFQRRPRMGLVPSKLYWRPSLLFTLITKFARDPLLKTFLLLT